MKKQFTTLMIILCITGLTTPSYAAQYWAIKADYTETCSCNPACPCLFGSPATHGHCEGNNLIEIRKGHYGGVKLDGISAVTAFSLGKWLKIYVDEKATDEQVQALVELLKLEQTFGIIYSGKTEMLSKEKAPISVEKTAARVKFSVADSMVEIERMEGKDGKPIKIQNLPVPFMNDHTQYKSITNTHKSEDKAFKHSGTNGLTASIDASSGK